MRYASILPNDVVNGKGVCVSFFVQGCSHHCPGCFNKNTWDFEGGHEFTDETLNTILEAISANGVKRNFSVLGGEPLDERNLEMTDKVITAVRNVYPDIQIYLWTGYTMEELSGDFEYHLGRILNNIDVLIDGPFIEEQKDLSLKLRGSSNQRIFIKEDGHWKQKD